MSRTLLVYGGDAYESEIELFRAARVTATRATRLPIFGQVPGIVYRVSHRGQQHLMPDIVDVRRFVCGHPEAAVELIPVRGSRRVAH